jgi:hypothetical protein
MAATWQFLIKNYLYVVNNDKLIAVGSTAEYCEQNYSVITVIEWL